jgi:SAM-dependent methyltransferase
MNKPTSTVEEFYKKNAGYEDDYDHQHGPRIDFVVERFGLDKLENQRVLDVGAGKGNFFKRMKPNNYFVGLDGALVGNKLCDFLSLRTDLNEPFAHLFDNEEKFDWLICSETLEHLSGINNALLEMKFLLKPNHYAIFTIPHVSVTHPVIYPGIIYPEQNFRIFIEQYAWIVEDYALYEAGWKTCCFKVRNAPMVEQRPLFPKQEAKFWGQTPEAWTNL